MFLKSAADIVSPVRIPLPGVITLACLHCTQKDFRTFERASDFPFMEQSEQRRCRVRETSRPSRRPHNREGYKPSDVRALFDRVVEPRNLLGQTRADDLETAPQCLERRDNRRKSFYIQNFCR
jgi:hypothetical protein